MERSLHVTRNLDESIGIGGACRVTSLVRCNPGDRETFGEESGGSTGQGHAACALESTANQINQPAVICQ